MLWNSRVSGTFAVSRGEHDEEAGKHQYISVNFSLSVRYWLPSLIPLSVAGSSGGSRLHSWLQLAGARVGNNDFVLCKSGLCVLSADAAFDHRGASAKSGSHRFNPHRLKQLLGDLKKQYFSSLLGVRHLRKSLLGHWLTTEITEEKHQILHATRNTYFVVKKKKSLEKSQIDGSSPQKARFCKSSGVKELDFQKSHNITLKMSSFKQKKIQKYKNRKV